MRKYLYFLAIMIVIFIYAAPAAAVNVFKHYEKVIWIDQPRQTGAAQPGKEKAKEPCINPR